MSDEAGFGSGSRAAKIRLYVRKHGLDGVAPALFRSVRYRLGIRDSPARYVDVADRFVHPIDALNNVADGVPVLELGFDRLRPYALSIPFSDIQRNPFSRTVHEFLHDDIDTFGSSALRSFYERWQPATLAAFHGVTGSQSIHLDAPPSPDSLPWISGAWPDDIRAGRRLHEEQMRRMFGTETEPHGFRSFGPVSRTAGEQFFRDYIELAASVREQGYREELGEQPVCELLVHGELWAARVLGGNHRCAVQSIVNGESFKIAIRPTIIDRRDAPLWPGVRSGMFTTQEAENVFDRFLYGRPPDQLYDLSP